MFSTFDSPSPNIFTNRDLIETPERFERDLLSAERMTNAESQKTGIDVM